MARTASPDLWIPAFAGMTGVEIGNGGAEIGNDGAEIRNGGAIIIPFSLNINTT